MGVLKKITESLNRIQRRCFLMFVVTKERKKVKVSAVSILSQNCIGGVFYHDMGWPFLSPTVNLFFTAEDFVKLACEPKRYFDMGLSVKWGPNYPIGTLDDITVHFMHYETCEQAKEAWDRRVKRVDYSRLIVLSTDRNGFDDAVFEQWKTVPYPKVLFTANPKFAKEEGSVFYPQYQQNGMVPDLIPKREFYKDDVLTTVVNQVR